MWANSDDDVWFLGQSALRYRNGAVEDLGKLASIEWYDKTEAWGSGPDDIWYAATDSTMFHLSSAGTGRSGRWFTPSARALETRGAATSIPSRAPRSVTAKAAPLTRVRGAWFKVDTSGGLFR